jgi:hypothetical protein
VGGDEVALGEDLLDPVAQVGEGSKEVFDLTPLTAPSARFAVVDEIDAEQALTGAGIASRIAS